jgi:4-alpha-glucanotransferase
MSVGEMTDLPRRMTRGLGDGRHAGVFVPLFSLASTRSWGIGEWPDVAPMAGWLQAAGQDLLQVLPLCEMTSGQCSPYSALSAMALDPIFIGLADLEDFRGAGGEAALTAAERAELARLRATPLVDYDGVRRLKTSALRLAFRRFLDAEWRPGSGRRAELESYIDAQAWWLEDFALFRVLHDRHGESPWTAWPDELRSREPAALARARAALGEEILFVQYLQWTSDVQWRRAREDAWPVALIGDMPFTVSWDSADVWAHQVSFDLTATVGAPPDAFSAAGQDWGLPPYRWEALRALGYEWLRQRARRSADLYDGCRIDHVVGFYRTYVRPRDGRPPRFVPATEPEQLSLGEEVLGALGASGLRIVAEDLGTIPDFVRVSLARLRIPGYRVLRWERAWKTPGQPFLDPVSYPAVSLATSGTHDVESQADWWDGLSRDERAKVGLIPALRGVPEQVLQAGYTAEIRDALLRALYQSGSDLVIVPIQDVFGWRDQINRPGTLSDANWTYRLPWPSDQLGVQPVALERAHTLRRWTERAGRAVAASSVSA